MEEQKVYRIILRHDISTQWMINDPVLLLGEYGVEDDTHRVKRGDGQTKWSDLNYDQFGLESIITFTNLKGDVQDNETLKTEFDNKLSKSEFTKFEEENTKQINTKADYLFDGSRIGLSSNNIPDTIVELKHLIDNLTNKLEAKDTDNQDDTDNVIVPPTDTGITEPTVPSDIEN